MAAGMSEIERRKGQDEFSEAKHMQQSTASPSDEGNYPWTAFRIENVDKIECSEEDAVVKSVDCEMERFRAHAVSPATLAPHDAFKYWKREGQTRFKHLRSVAQHVLGNQVSAAQIDRDFRGARKLLSSRKGRFDVSYVEMLFFLHVTVYSIPSHIPAIKIDATGELLPKMFTG